MTTRDDINITEMYIQHYKRESKVDKKVEAYPDVVYHTQATGVIKGLTFSPRDFDEILTDKKVWALSSIGTTALDSYIIASSFKTQVRNLFSHHEAEKILNHIETCFKIATIRKSAEIFEEKTSTKKSILAID